MLTLLPKGVQTKLLKIFWLKIFPFVTGVNDLSPVSTTPVVHTELRIFLNFWKVFETTLMVYSGAWGKLIHEKYQKSKISWYCPFNLCFFFLLDLVSRHFSSLYLFPPVCLSICHSSPSLSAYTLSNSPNVSFVMKLAFLLSVWQSHRKRLDWWKAIPNAVI